MTRDLEAVDGERSAATEIAPRFYNIQFPPDFGVYVAPNCVTHTLNGTVDPQFHRSRRKVERHDLSWLPHTSLPFSTWTSISLNSLEANPWVTVSWFRTTMIVSCDGWVIPTV